MSDGTRQKLTLPSWHVPYLEKHKIMELFHEIAREIVIKQPSDHLMFTKQLLQRAAQNIHVSRVLLLSSPKVNCLEVAKQIAQQTKHELITDDLIVRCLNVETREQIRPGKLTYFLSCLLRTNDAQNNGWILVDCIKTAKEAKKLIKSGIIPTHVLHLIPPFSPPLKELLYCHVLENWSQYRREIMGVRDVFKNKLVVRADKSLEEIFLRQRFIHEVVKECIEVIQIRDRCKYPIQVRLLLIGPRGSGRNTQAQIICQKLNLIHVNFQNILCEAYASDDEIGKMLRECKGEVCYHSDLLSKVINDRILKDDCLTQGWVLTGFPFTVLDLKYLDTLDTPPNRVIFLECDLNICKERLINRRTNVYTGSITDIIQKPENIQLKRLKVHPKDKISVVNAEMNYYCEQYGSLRNYCGETAQVVNADQPERWISECILAFITKGTSSAAPRNPCMEDDEKHETSMVEETPSSDSFQIDIVVAGPFKTKIM